jgi:hypothetical protein
MQHGYYLPKFREPAFHCPFCSVYAKQIWSIDVSSRPPQLGYVNIEDLQASRCTHCWRFSLWIKEKMIFPDISEAPIPNSDMPENVKEDYLEAASISGKSPRGAASLLRLAIQKLCIYLGQKGKNLDDDIAVLVKDGLPVRIQKALDIVRVIGNNAVHPGVIDLKDDQDTVNTLFNLINQIVQDRITQPKEVDALYETLPEAARTAIDKRDTSKP